MFGHLKLYFLVVGCLLASFRLAAGELSSPLAYDLSAYELEPRFRFPQDHPWTFESARQEFTRRVALEKQRREMQVYYYRVGYTLSFPLLLESRPTAAQLPAEVVKSQYPYLIWLAWNMEERWLLFHTAWRKYGDQEAGLLLQQELAALAGWDKFMELNEQVGLITGHFAGVLATVLADPSGWDPKLFELTRRAAVQLLERDIAPWFQTRWKPKELVERDLQNIPVIALMRAAQLSRVISSPHAPALEQRCRQVLERWCALRMASHYTEGTAYDGFLMDSVTAWLEAAPGNDELKRACAPAFGSLIDSWLNLTLPGRLDLHAPIGDVEPEMTFWVNALQRINRWQESPNATWLLRRFPLNRMRAQALIGALSLPPGSGEGSAPASLKRELPNAIVFRTGWSNQDLLAAVSLTRVTMSHLHADSGTLVLGHSGRFWITDPGYQQYRPGEEREFTLGPNAHNCPVINGTAQTLRNPVVVETASDRSEAVLDLTRCYNGLPAKAVVRRIVSVQKGNPGTVTVYDTFQGLAPNSEIRTSWQGGHHLSWAFRDGRARLSDDAQTLWISTSSGPIAATDLIRHPGSRGPLTLSHTNLLASGYGTNTWVFQFSSDLSFAATKGNAPLQKPAEKTGKRAAAF